jgi:O-antigen/teichoic acid export membrane protein
VLSDSEAAPPDPSGRERPKRATVRRNVTTNYLVAIVLVITGFVTTPILTHQLGIVRYGVWALIGSLIPFLEILELGFASATVAFVGRHLELGDHDRVGATLNTSLVILSVLGLVAFAGVVVFAVFLPDIITSIPKNLVGQAQFLLVLLAFDMALSIPLDTFGGTLIAMQRFDLLNYSLIVVIVAQACGWVLVLWLHGGLIALGVVTVVISELGQLSRVIMIHRLLPWFRLSLRQFDRHIVKTFTAASGWYSVGQISDAVLYLADVLVVGAAAGVSAAAVYSVAQRLGQLPLRAVQPRTNVMFATGAELAARDNWAGLRDTLDGVVRFVLGLSIPAALALGFLAGPALEAWVGPLYREAAPIIGLLCLAGVISAWAQSVKLTLNGAGRPKLGAMLYGIEMVIHVGLGLVLASRYGAVGMAEAALVGVVVMEGLLMLPLGYRNMGGSVLPQALRAVRTLALPAAVTGVLAYFLGRGGGPLYMFVDTHGRVIGMTVVAAAGTALVVVFYAVLLISAPTAQRQELLVRCRSTMGRFAARLH